jgi:uncharacterized protein
MARTIRRQRISFRVALTVASRAVQARDWAMRRIPGRRAQAAHEWAAAGSIQSGDSLLDAVFVTPGAGAAKAAVLICHGIGEIVPQWFPIQELLAQEGVASLVFDYSGYGRSTGTIDWRQFERDSIAAFDRLKELAPNLPLSLLGFSLGSGIAAQIAGHVKAERLVLCAGFTSFRDAARAAWVPGWLSPLVPPIWAARESLRECCLPVLVVQGDRDKLFNPAMGRELVSHCGANAEFIQLPARSHNEPFYNPQPHYWGPIISFLLGKKTGDCQKS